METVHKKVNKGFGLKDYRIFETPPAKKKKKIQENQICHTLTLLCSI